MSVDTDPETPLRVALAMAERERDDAHLLLIVTRAGLERAERDLHDVRTERDMARAILSETQAELEEVRFGIAELSRDVSGPKLGGTTDVGRLAREVAALRANYEDVVAKLEEKVATLDRGECIHCADHDYVAKLWYDCSHDMLGLEGAPPWGDTAVAATEARALLSQALETGLAECGRLRVRIANLESGVADLRNGYATCQDCFGMMEPSVTSGCERCAARYQAEVEATRSERDALVTRVGHLRAALERVVHMAAAEAPHFRISEHVDDALQGDVVRVRPRAVATDVRPARDVAEISAKDTGQWGWTGRVCPKCNACGEADDGPCPACGGTGDEYGPL